VWCTLLKRQASLLTPLGCAFSQAEHACGARLPCSRAVVYFCTCASVRVLLYVCFCTCALCSPALLHFRRPAFVLCVPSACLSPDCGPADGGNVVCGVVLCAPMFAVAPLSTAARDAFGASHARPCP
jgi:hypothetical protein